MSTTNARPAAGELMPLRLTGAAAYIGEQFVNQWRAPGGARVTLIRYTSTGGDLGKWHCQCGERAVHIHVGAASADGSCYRPFEVAKTQAEEHARTCMAPVGA